MTGDPHTLTMLVVRLRAEAERTRDVTSRIGQARQVAWQSVAARAFRAHLDHVVHGLHRVAGELEEAAVALEGHAVAVRAAREAIAHLAAREPAT